MLAPFDAVTLDEDPSSICALTTELRISYVNRAWFRFATDNDASWADGDWGIGTLITNAIPAILRPFYDELFRVALERREIVEHDYECSTPTLRRYFRMRILPCESGALLCVHSPLRESSHVAPGNPALESRYRDGEGLILQCSNCRRVRCVTEPVQWEWVPAYVAEPMPDTSHGLCAVCTDYYYPTSPTSTPRRSTILVVDDSSLLRALAARILRRAGYTVIEADSGASGLDVLRQTEIDLVVADISMPGIDGLTTVAAMRRIRPRLSVVLMSGFDESVATSGEVGEALFLPKPFSPTSLSRVVERALSQG